MQQYFYDLHNSKPRISRMKLINTKKITSIKLFRELYFLFFRPMRAEGENYDYLKWNALLEWAWKFGGSSFRAFLVRKILSSSPHYLYPKNNLYFVSGEYEDALSKMRDSREEIANEVLSKFLNTEDEVLEFGCGPGIIVGAVSRYCQRSTGVDVSQTILKVAEELNRDVKNVSFQRSSGMDLQVLTDQSFSFIYSIECIQHIDKVHSITFFHEFYRVLKPGGRLLVQFPDLTREEECEAWFEGTWKPQSERSYSDLTMMRIRYYTPEELKIILTRIGFKSVRFLDYELNPVERSSVYFLATR
jgi:ubiquinone/menaquinone biosynthesis C-methylase UbiE